MQVGDLIRPKRDPGCVALVLNTACLEWSVNRIKVLVVGETKPEMCDPRMWEVIEVQNNLNKLEAGASNMMNQAKRGKRG